MYTLEFQYPLRKYQFVAENVLQMYCLHKGSGQAYVKIKGKRFYFGPHGAAESKGRYSRFIAEPAATPLDVSTIWKSVDARLSAISLIQHPQTQTEDGDGVFVRGVGRVDDHLYNPPADYKLKENEQIIVIGPTSSVDHMLDDPFGKPHGKAPV